MTKRRRDIMVSVAEDEIQLVEDTYVRLYTELLELKRIGIIPKSKRITESVLKSLIFSHGLGGKCPHCKKGYGVREVDWREFDAMCSEKSIYKRGRT